MLTFSQDFFLEETRDGFTIEPMMKCAWAAQLEVLTVIEQICDRHGLKYSAFWGTLLGVVRHKGFIPWDDDIDICLLRDDYDKLLAAAATELPDGYRILNPYTNEEWDQTFSRIINSNTVSYEEERLRKFHGCPYVVGVDIFPLDELPEDPQLESYHTELFSTVYSSGRLYAKDPAGTDAVLPDLEALCNVKFDRSKSIPNQLFRLADAIGKEYRSSGSPFVTSIVDHALKRIVLRKERFLDRAFLPFEHLHLPAPADYDAVLTALYGDYMTPVRYAADHDYPFYRKQQELYEQSLAKNNKQI